MSSDNHAGRPPAFLSITGLTVGYGGPPVISNVDASIGLGEVVSVVGPNGAGKSTLLKAVAGILTPNAGRVLLETNEITGLRSDQLARRGVGYVPQVNDCFEALTVTENLEMGGYLLNRADSLRRQEEVLEIMPTLKRMLKRPAVKLSGGERKMLAVARVLMLKPRLLLLDEPTANLSPEVSTNLLHNHIRALGNSGTAVFIVEQKAQAALEISDWTYVLASGGVKISASSKSLLAREDLGEVFLGRSA
jgi:ABC-type branched-subunit amino acid transport system ATPase component